ncbi:MAG: bifunctional riboflavin kinase/FAD synthetase [Fimbriimonas sp.]
MQVHLGTGTLRAEWPRAVVCVGTFDGVHLGHQAVIRRAVADAREAELPCILVTFDRHPASILAPSKTPPSLASTGENLQRFEALGVTLVLILPFDAALSRMSADQFLEEILRKGVKAERIVVGHDFAMGNGREGTTEWLAARIPTDVVPPFELEGHRVSSSDIRRAVLAGDVEHAHALLGRPYELEGTIVGGQRLGRELGFPTANLARSANQALPADGVYAGWFESPHGRHRAATSVGTRPAVGGNTRTVETYLLDYPGDSLYGLPVRLEFHRRLRDEWNFPSLEALKDQIAADVEQVRALV